MSYVFYIARRFLQFQKTARSQGFISFLTFFAIAGIMLGVSALIIALTILGGFEKELKEKIFGFTAHIQITGFQNRSLTNYQLAEKKLQQISSIKTISQYVAKEGMINYGEESDGVLVKGIQQNSIEGVSKYLKEGTIEFRKYDEGLYGCVIGKKLLEKIDAKLLDTVLVFGLPSDFSSMGQPKIIGFIVTGVYESGMAEYDDVYLFTGIDAAQELFALGNSISGFDITLNNPAESPEVAKTIMGTLGFPYNARTIYQMYRNLFTWIELQKEPIPVILGLISIVASINIIGTLLMVVLEKKRNVGILRSLGATQKDIQWIFLLQGFFIAVIGTVLGNIFAFTICWLELRFQFFSLPSSIYFMSSVPVLFTAKNFILVSSLSIVLSTIAAYVPARLASKIDPIKAIRN